ncbi:hypothetical protein M409DRAFT_19425 [Zasmidium cellare ATCC 36951]|uniref:Uncharacterized protein n=1 Tax=Zasmidium cellare ATCC 36951 TaxID=1080233 RepID=A0A6A6CWM7_ZASCE|nr:uncharacterized protein M409DRAFT_19425 [Zasmidium cellare ATCC 36951]KAF2170608.1 hypothetical protein M409DRAFT_19425 [Zasmidium cellare ATCC 36951]
MKLTLLTTLLSLASGSLAWFNCELAKGGDYGVCWANNGDEGNFACVSTNPCNTAGNGCTPIGAGLASCS